MGLRLFLMLFVIRAVHLAPAKHTYESVNRLKTTSYKPTVIFRNGRQTQTFNAFGQGTLGGQQGGIGTQAAYDQGTLGSQQGGFDQAALGGQQGAVGQPPFGAQQGSFDQSSAFGQAALGAQQGAFENQQQFGAGDLSANGFGQAQNLGLGQTAGLNGAAGFGQNFAGFDGQSQNLGFGQAAAGQDQSFGLQLGQGQLAQQQNLGFGQDQGLGLQFGQGQQQNFGFGQAAGQDQGFGFGQGQLNANQGFGQNQGFAQGFDQNGAPAALNQGFGQVQVGGAGFNQAFDQGQSFGQDQGFGQQQNADFQQQQQFGPTAAAPAGQPQNQIFTPANQDLANSFGGSNEKQQEESVEIGGKKNYQKQNGDGQGGFDEFNGQNVDGPVVTKDFYLHAAPEDFEDDELELKKLKLGPSRKHYNVVFIKAPSLSAKSAAIKLLQAKNEEKTIVYVLSKQLDSAEIRANIKSLPVHASKPEVFFIKYKTPEEAVFAQQKIQAQFDSLGGTSRVSDEGVSPITSVVGALGGGSGGFGPDQQGLDNGQQQGQFDKSQQQGAQQGISNNFGTDQNQLQFPIDQAGQYPNAQRKDFDNGQQQYQDGGDKQFNAGEGIIQPRIGNGDKPVLDGEAIGKIQNFGAAGEPTVLNRRQSKPRH